jgi:hypothetical protein
MERKSKVRGTALVSNSYSALAWNDSYRRRKRL